MRKLLTSPNSMPLGETEQTIYQQALTYVAELSLNLMAVKVEHHPEDFLNWCIALHDICKHKVNRDLLEPAQEKPLKKLQELMATAVSVCQIKTLRVLPWPMFAEFIKQQSTLHALPERLRLLDYINNIKVQQLTDLIAEDRLAYIGKHSTQHDPKVYDFDVEWFGSTRGAKVFLQLLNDDAKLFDQALSCIPLSGDVNYSHYQAFIEQYQAIFKQHGEKAPLAPASRLLAMRRPDYFMALTNAKLDALSQGFAIIKLNAQSFDDYWHEVIATIHASPWWRSEQPEDTEELILWRYRAVLIDLFYFADSSLAESSNYLRLLNKPKTTKSTASKGVKRSQESAEAIVDKALQAEDMPEFIKNMRSTIVNSVKDGKSVEQAITLMRNIFG